MIVITLRGRKIRVEARKGTTLLDLAHEHGVPLRYACRRADCGTCMVRVTGEGLEGPSAAERAVLAHVGAGDGARLACQARVAVEDADLEVSITP